MPASSPDLVQYTLEHAPDAVYWISQDGRFTYVNQSACRSLGYTRDELLNLHVCDIDPCMTAEQWPGHWQNSRKRGSFTIATKHCRKNGDVFPVEVAINHLEHEGVEYHCSFARDITDRRLAERKAKRMSDLYAALSHCGQAIMRCTDADELFPKICRAAVRFGGMKMAWIGLVDEASQLVRPVAAFGTGMEYLEGIEISINADHPAGRGPCGVSIRENQPYWCQDFLNDPNLVLWRERGVLAGWGSSAALPLHCHGKTLGVFNIYAGEANAFDEVARNLLLEMAEDVCYALETYKMQAERRKVEEQLILSEKRYRILFENVVDYALLLEMREPSPPIIVDANEAAFARHGYTREEMIGQPITLLDKVQSHEALAERVHQIEAGKPAHFETEHTCKDGSTFAVEVISQLVEYEGRKLLYAIERDISEHKTQQEALLQSEEKFRQLVENVEDVFWVVSPDWSEVFYISPAYEKVWGGSCAELYMQPRAWLNAVVEEDRGKISKAADWKNAGDAEGLIFPEYRILRPDGAQRWILARAYPIRDAQGTVVRIAGIAEDITERKQAEMAVRQSEEKFRVLMQSAIDAIFIADADTGLLLDVNTSAERLTGYTRQELVGMHQSRLHPESESEYYAELFRRYVGSNGGLVSAPVYVQHRDGRLVPVEISTGVAEVGGKRIMQGIFRDISERQEQQESLQKSEARLRALAENLPAMLYMKDMDGRHVLMNKGVEQAIGRPRTEALGKTVFDFFPEEAASVMSENDRSIIESKQACTFEERIQKDDRVLFYQATKFPVLDDAGKAIGIGGVTFDVTEHKQNEERLRKLSQAVDHAGEAVIITDRHAIIEYVNPAFTEITGYTYDEACGRNATMLKSSAQNPVFYKDLWETITRGEVWHGTLIDKRKDGSFYPALMSVAPIDGEDGKITHYVGIQQDMSEYRRLEEQFQQSQKMEAIGVLVGGIAHDFNNMLAGIMGNTYLARSRVKGNEALLRKLETIDKLSLRAAAMIKQMLTFARKDRLEMQVFSLTDFAREALKLAATALPEDIERSWDVPSEELFVHGDATQLQQVLMNLINNARDALEGVKDGRITVSLRAFTADAAFRQSHPDCSGKRFACLSVMDNGQGIPEEIVNKIFDPFFTTKEVDRGTGLGLAMVYGSVASHKGAIDVDSVAGQGTTFNIYLPLSSQSAAQKQASPWVTEAGNKELILIADDEDLVRQMYQEVLHALGYRVIAARDGGEAVSLFEHNRDAVSLIILDVVMPVMGGVDAARKIRRLQPKIPVVFATGYDRKTTLKEEDDIADCQVMNKPFTVEALSSIIRSLLD